MTGLKVGPIFYGVGTGSFLHCFFSNIAYHLEGNRWGSRYPTLMNKLYKGELPNKDINNAKNELEEIKERFKMIMPDQVIWDIENPKQRPPWGDKIAGRITNLSNYFYTSDGKDLFDVLFTSLETALKVKKDISIKSL
ncbi:immunity 70 family protein [Pedobacter alluvionis]|uniref:Immunity protein 70 of polymorphic toxin system n=1 Tax=Pedobacter alluvionis TaxID=475253 RepID=A0A497Y6K9_9SPHI|nr:immunity 70 family protein [Pedobacter alluvionis]RLJ77790.1 immunity protein 70 of polymorphic toxin system [Pedobacter alluvionis]TFB33012.1 hypothetical protein E3V97_02940 [Pedobacter alluvionis]